jgi:hypothetical protein
MHRRGQQREDLLQSKLATLQGIDTELRAIEQALHERHGVTVLREAGVTACPRCAAIHGSEDRFCPACGFSISRGVEQPIAAQPVATASAGAVQDSASSASIGNSIPTTPITPTVTPATASSPPASGSSPAQSARPTAAQSVSPTPPASGSSPAQSARPTAAQSAPPTPPASPNPPAPPNPSASPNPPAPPTAPAPGGPQSPPSSPRSRLSTPRAPTPPAPATPTSPASADEGKEQPTEVIDPPTQIVRPGQSERQ